MSGYDVTPDSRRDLARFRRTLSRQGSHPPVCPPRCTLDHDQDKTPGSDHWKPKAKARR